jgi:hypothetical protein
MVFLQLSESLRERSVGNQGQGGRRARNLRAKKKKSRERAEEERTMDKRRGLLCGGPGLQINTDTGVGKGPQRSGPVGPRGRPKPMHA